VQVQRQDPIWMMPPERNRSERQPEPAGCWSRSWSRARVNRPHGTSGRG